MTFGERLKGLRLERGLSQEKVAEQLGVTRQAVAKWEGGASMPSAENLVALSDLYQVSLDQLARVRTGGMTIRQTNLTTIAIIAQAAALNVCIQPMYGEEYGLPRFVLLCVKFIPLVAASIWMAFNLNYEKDQEKRRRNAGIELGYCAVQGTVAVCAWLSRLYGVGTLAILAVALIYLLRVNPKYMDRPLTRQRNQK